MIMRLLSGGRLRMRRNVFDPTAPRDQTFELSVCAGLLQHPQGNVLFDTGCNPEAATNPQSRWGGIARAMVPIFNPEDTVPANLAQIGLAPDDIDAVICSHLHPDHCGCASAFRRATIFCHAAELAAAKTEGAESLGYLPADWNIPQGYTTFTTETDLFNDGRIVLLPLPGHTEGTTALLATLDRDGAFLLASDTAPLEANLKSDQAPRNTQDPTRALAAFAEIRRLQSAGATIVFGHDDTQFQRLRHKVFQ